jgi:hypothetical protein
MQNYKEKRIRPTLVDDLSANLWFFSNVFIPLSQFIHDAMHAIKNGMKNPVEDHLNRIS